MASKAKRTAAARAKVKYGQQRSDLQSLLGEAGRNLQTDLVAADAASRSAQHYARASKPEIKNIYDTASRHFAGAKQDVANSTAVSGPVASLLSAITTREQADADQRLASSRARSLSSLNDRIQAAVAGKAYAQTAATDKYRTTVSDLQKRLRDVGDQEGSFIVSEMADIEEKNADRAAKRSDTLSTITKYGIPESEWRAMTTAQRQQVIKDFNKKSGGASTKGVGGAKPATRAEMRDFQGTFAKALRHINTLKADNKGKSRGELANTLIKGQRGDPTKNVADVPSIGDQLALSMALDMAYDGHISRANARKLHAGRGIRVADVPGAVSYASWAPRATGYSKGKGRPD